MNSHSCAIGLEDKYSTFLLIVKLWGHFSIKRKKQFWMILILMFFTSLMEVISIGAVLPFLGALTAPDYVYSYPEIQPIIRFFQLSNPNQIILPLTIIFILAAFIAGTSRLILLYVLTKFSFAVGADISIDIYRKTLYQNYSKHISHNSVEVINGIITKTDTIINLIIIPILTFISSIALIIAIFFTIFMINAYVAFIVFSGFGAIYWTVGFYTKKALRGNSVCVAKNSTIMIKSLQEGLGGIRDVLINGSQEFFCKYYRDSDLLLRKAAGNNLFISASPRYVIEAIGIALISLTAYVMSTQEGGVISVIPVLGVLALGSQRAIPVLQQIYNTYTSVQGSYNSFLDVINLLNQSLPDHVTKKYKTIPFHKDIILNGVSFRHNNESNWVLSNVDLVIKKGSCTGFFGKTGSGKSTLVDIIMGLIPPVDGRLLVDGVSINEENSRGWQDHIAHVPQDIFLFDSTIEENIAFGVNKHEIDFERIKKAASQAQINDFIQGLPQQYKTVVGERGVRLSGGQKQRIGIARALYNKVDVLVFDEATSALDIKTEESVMKSINNLKKDITILMITHRLETLKKCDNVIELKDMKIIQNT
jgi:ATP-binding cassette, subfamily B, bacterial PglK